MSITLSKDQADALIWWADEGDRKGGTTAWGPKFSAVMEVARAVRQQREEEQFTEEPQLYRATKPVDCPNCGAAGCRQMVDNDNTHIGWRCALCEWENLNPDHTERPGMAQSTAHNCPNCGIVGINRLSNKAWNCMQCGYLDDDENHFDRPGPSEAEVSMWCVAILEDIVRRCNKDGNQTGKMVIGFSPDWGGNALTLHINDSHTHVGGAAAFSILIRSLHEWMLEGKGMSLGIRVESQEHRPLHESDQPGVRPLISEMMELIVHAMNGRQHGFDYDEWMMRAKAAEERYMSTLLVDAQPLSDKP